MTIGKSKPAENEVHMPSMTNPYATWRSVVQSDSCAHEGFRTEGAVPDDRRPR